MVEDPRITKIIKLLETENYKEFEQFIISQLEKLFQKYKDLKLHLEREAKYENDFEFIQFLRFDFDKYYLEHLKLEKLYLSTENEYILKYSWNRVLLQKLMDDLFSIIFDLGEEIDIPYHNELKKIVDKFPSKLDYYLKNMPKS